MDQWEFFISSLENWYTSELDRVEEKVCKALEKTQKCCELLGIENE